MITAERKPLEKILRYVQGRKRVLVLACGECVTVCHAGGEREARMLATELRTALRDAPDKPEILVDVAERQCDTEFIAPLEEKLRGCDAIISMACGVGVNFVADFLNDIPVFPALNTKFMGGTKEHGVWEELCAGCGDCILDLTGGICPVARCAKTLMNGPCGGSQDGMCELGEDRPCAWVLIYERMKKLGTLDQLERILPPKDWRTARDGGPRRIVREDLVLPKDEEQEDKEAASSS